MPINPNIALSGRGIELANPLEQYGRMVSIQQAQQQNALAQQQLGALQRAEAQNRARTNALAQAGGDETAIANALLQSGDLEGYTSFLKQSREANKANVELVNTKLAQSRAFLEGIDPDAPDAAEQFIAWHQANHRDPTLGPVLRDRGITPEQSMARINAAVAQGPGGLARLLNESKLGIEKFAELTFRGRSIAVQEEQNRLRAQELAGKGAATGTDKSDAAAFPALSQAILDGRVPVARVNSRTAPIFERALEINPNADLTSLNVEQTGASAGARTAGTAKANIAIASDEANRMIEIMRGIIPTVNLTTYPSINAVQNAVTKGTGGVEIVELNTAINSLINSYARAINPRGQPTVSDKNHARDIINNAMSKGQLDGALNIMQKEMEAALGAATTATKPRGKDGETTKRSTGTTKSGVSYTVED